MNDSLDIDSTQEKKDRDEECIARAEILYDHQKAQYELAVDGLRRLEDKATKIFGFLSLIITLAVLIVRYWWNDIFPTTHTHLHIFCWLFLGAFIFFSLISWGFVFSAMQPKNFERPSSDANELEKLFMRNARQNSLTAYAREYSRLTNTIDENHVEKVHLIKSCAETMLFGAWCFVIFLISFLLLKFTI
ncbi:hypothetical protein [Rahnella bonaserana]